VNIDSTCSNFFTVDNLEYSDHEIARIVQDIEATGIVEIKDAFQPWVLDEARDYIDIESKRINTDYFSLRAQDMKPCVLTQLQKSSALKKMFCRILTGAGVEARDDEYVHHVVRSIRGETNNLASRKYHFDQYNLTALMPLTIPDSEELDCGDLIIFPNIRKFGGGIVKNLCLKFLVQNQLTRSFATQKWFHWLFNGRRVKMKPGNMYLFWGFRTYHGNDLIDPSLLRVTGIFHYNDHFEDNEVINRVTAYRPRPQDRIGLLASFKVKVGLFRVLLDGLKAENAKRRS